MSRSDSQLELFGAVADPGAARADRMGSVEAARWEVTEGSPWHLERGAWRMGSQSRELLVGLDEAGRGPLAGPVSVAAVALVPDHFSEEGRPDWMGVIDDSKRLKEAQREELYSVLLEEVAGFAIVHVHSDHIDRVNILQATLQGMAMAVEGLLGVDGPAWPEAPEEVRAGVPSAESGPCWYADALDAEVQPVGADVIASPIDAERATLLIDGNTPVLVAGSAAAGMSQHTIKKGDALSVHIAAASVLAKVSRDRMMALADELWPGYGFAGHKGYPTKKHKAAVVSLGACPIHRRSFSGVG